MHNVLITGRGVLKRKKNSNRERRSVYKGEEGKYLEKLKETS